VRISPHISSLQEYMALGEEFQAAMSLHYYCNIKYKNRPKEGHRGAPGQQQNADLVRIFKFSGYTVTTFNPIITVIGSLKDRQSQIQ
jgi:hypothetical protein